MLEDQPEDNREGQDLALPTRVELPGNASCNVPFSSDVVARIARLYSQGMSLAQVCRQAEMPNYETLFRWIKDHPEMKQALEGVRGQRALHYEDKALQAAEEACGKDADRLRFDAFRWGAEVNDPSRYGKKVTHSGDSDKPIQFIIQTGFPEPNSFQTPPKLGADGLIERAKPIVADFIEAVADDLEDGEQSDGANDDDQSSGPGDEHPPEDESFGASFSGEDKNSGDAADDSRGPTEG
jgi:transposase-like protein